MRKPRRYHRPYQQGSSGKGLEENKLHPMPAPTRPIWHAILADSGQALTEKLGVPQCLSIHSCSRACDAQTFVDHLKQAGHLSSIQLIASNPSPHLTSRTLQCFTVPWLCNPSFSVQTKRQACLPQPSFASPNSPSACIQVILCKLPPMLVTRGWKYCWWGRENMHQQFV